MKRYVLLIVVVLLGTLCRCAAQDILDRKFSINLKKISLEDALFTLMDEADINLTFSNDLIPTRVISINLKRQPLRTILSTLFRETNIGFQLVGDQIVLFKKPAPKRKRKFTISGFLEDAESGERLIGATIWDLTSGQGTITNAYGFFSLTLDEGKAEIQFNYLGYEPFKELYDLTKSYSAIIALERSLTLPEVEVVASDSTVREIRTGFSPIAIKASDIESMTSLGGEPDLARFTHLLPGVTTGTDGVGGLMVRGGSSGQNLILIDDVPVYDFGHGAGMFSVVNPLAISQATLIKGGFPARYSGRLSSVIDIRTREGNKQEFKARADLSLISGRLSLEGPIIKGKTSFFASGRVSYLNWFLSPLGKRAKAKNDLEGATLYDFYDFNLKLNHELGEKDHLFLSVYKGADKYEDESILEERLPTPIRSVWIKRDKTDEISWLWGNTTASLRWNHVFSNRLFANTTLTYSNLEVGYRYGSEDLLVHQVTDEEIRYFDFHRFASSIEDRGGRMDFDYMLSPKQNLHFGAKVVNHHFNPGVQILGGEQDPSSEVFNQAKQDAWEIAGYVEDEFRPVESLLLNIGLSFVNWRVEGRDYQSWQPRLSAYWNVGPHFGLKASYAQMSQFIHRLSRSSIGLPGDLWVGSTKDTPPQNSKQVTLGFEYETPDHLMVGVEGYYKDFTNILDYAEGATFLRNWEDNVTSGNGRAYGVEFFVEKDQGNLQGWISYTLSWADRQFDKINNGERFPFQFDRRHDFKIAIKQKLAGWLSFSANWQYSSGFATTVPIESYVVIVPDGVPGSRSGVVAQDFGQKNSFRMPDYHRLDMSLQAQHVTDRNVHVFGVGAYNVYDRRNPLYYRLDREFGFVNDELRLINSEFVQGWLLPFVPYLSYSIRF